VFIHVISVYRNLGMQVNLCDKHRHTMCMFL